VAAAAVERKYGGGSVEVTKGRLEAFSDGVIAIIITIMVLELRVPHAPEWAALRPLAPVFVSYVLSFVFIGIYWNNHHHMLQAVHHVDGRILWANLHLLFWISLFPFVTAWMGETGFAAVPVAAYGGVLLFAACAYYVLSQALIARHGPGSALATAVGSDFKGRISVIAYLVALPLAFASPWISCLIYAAVAVMWLVPDRRIERTLIERARPEP
jgi:uncharacterized membrane protein